ncbi:MAG: ABC transporter ATP-binding protein [Ethanoligenens sp.]
MKQKKKRLILRLMHYEGAYRVTMILSWVFAAVAGGISIGAYTYFYHAAKVLVMQRSGASAALLAHDGWMAVQFVAGAFTCYGFSLILSHLTAFSTMSSIRIRLLRHMHNIPLGYHMQHPSGALRKLMEKNVESIENFIAHQMPDTAQSVVMPVAFLISMFYFDWRMSIVCLLPVAVGFIALSAMLKDENSAFIRQYQQALDGMSNAGVEYVRGIAVIKVFGQTVRSFKRFAKSIQDYKTFALRYVLSFEKPMRMYITAINGIFFVLIPTAILLYRFGGNPRETIMSLIFFTIFTPLVSVMLMRIMLSSSNAMMASQALDTIDGMLAVPMQQSVENAKLPETYTVNFENVTFRYGKGAPNALDGLSFTAKEGQITALVGASGSGKSTIANLLAKFWDPSGGSIRIGNMDIQSLDPHRWMKQCSFVFQDAQLLKMSIAENVAFCKPSANVSEIRTALRLAQCDDIIEKLPDGIHTVIGSKGVYLSGGEQQRIALARAFLQDAPLVLLDEATSFADPENEYRIQQALNSLIRGKTVIMIAHRLSTVTQADQIIVIQAGRFCENGTHAELMRKGGLYAAMFREYSAGVSWKIGDTVHA